MKALLRKGKEGLLLFRYQIECLGFATIFTNAFANQEGYAMQFIVIMQ